MKYVAPKNAEGKEHFVPLVAKNKDYVVGYIHGVRVAEMAVAELFEMLGLSKELATMPISLDSTRYNDILRTGVRESDLSEEELIKYYSSVLEEYEYRYDDENPDRNVFDDTVLNVECSCGLGFVHWNTFADIPSETTKCPVCGEVIVHYTDVNEYDLEFDYGGEK